MVVLRKVILFLVSIVLLWSCSVNRSIESQCNLDEENNIIKGNYKDAKVFYDEIHFIPRIIENFLKEGKKPSIEYRDFSRKAKRKYAGYHIYGCRDTTWAKLTMAYHLMNKYHINRFDSTYYDTVYMINVVDESKLEMSNDSCHFFMSLGSRFNNVVGTEYKCVTWGVLCRSLIPYGMNENTNSVDGEDRLGHYNIKIPTYLYRDQGFEAYQKYLNDYLGLGMTIDRIDTINIGFYKYIE